MASPADTGMAMSGSSPGSAAIAAPGSNRTSSSTTPTIALTRRMFGLPPLARRDGRRTMTAMAAVRTDATRPMLRQCFMTDPSRSTHARLGV